MDISEIISDDYDIVSQDTEVSKLAGRFEDPLKKGVIVESDDGVEGVVTRRQLATTQHQPEQKVRSIVWHVPRLAPDEDVRKTAQLMIDSDSQFLPVFEGQQLVGVVTSDDILDAVKDHLDAVDVRDAYSGDLVSIAPDDTFGKALNVLRENQITHLPVVEGEDPVGVLSLYEVTNVAVRAMEQNQGGEGGGVSSTGAEISSSAGNTRRGGYGARDGEREDMLEIPVRDLMVSPIQDTSLDAPLDQAAKTMLESDVSSLVVENSGDIAGIVTKTDILDSLTWEAGGNRGVQLYGSELLDDMSYDDVVAMIDKFDSKDGSMSVLDAKIHLQDHDEKKRGTPLILARIRLHTDNGLFMASGEGYGAKHALNEASDVMERRLRDSKTHGQSKKPPSEEHWEKRFGWWLEE